MRPHCMATTSAWRPPALSQVKPKMATLITPEDLEVSGMSGIFFSMLADVKLFHNYNYRENFIHQEDS
ncbi:hypothetical protein QJQ45_024883 [Haematococcus lacustris]|nr:hypothetical protein QJQ45_024883 [Haematococcus lacustris]